MYSSNVIQLPTALRTPLRTGAAIATTSAKILPLDKFRPNARATVQTPNALVSPSPVAASATDAPLTAGDLWDAITAHRVVMHYQPQYDMRTGETVAAEALVRLIDIEGQLIYPDRFIDMAEQSDIIVPLGRAVIEQVCADLAAFRADGFVLQRMAINLSARQLNLDASLVEFIDQMVARHGLKYDDLEFELTERQSLTPNCEGIALLSVLAERGARIVIDDFGIGYSSVLYLTELPISAFKLDRALVNRLPEDKAMQSVVKSLLMLAKDLELEVVAEGIETKEQNEYLARAGCLLAQGFGYAKPMAIGALRTFLTEATSVDRWVTQE
jgi:EAL domain-containing protein (putative c-di-GMP-specific phosphodiesterase class I)